MVLWAVVEHGKSPRRRWCCGVGTRAPGHSHGVSLSRYHVGQATSRNSTGRGIWYPLADQQKDGRRRSSTTLLEGCMRLEAKPRGAELEHAHSWRGVPLKK